MPSARRCAEKPPRVVGQRAEAEVRSFGRGSRAARGVCGGPARGVAEVLAAASDNGHVLWAADIAGEEGDDGREAACVLFCAACGSYVIQGTPQRLRRCCPGAAATRAAGSALARIWGGRHPTTRCQLGIGRPWRVAVTGRGGEAKAAGREGGAGADRAAERDEDRDAGLEGAGDADGERWGGKGMDSP